MTPQQVYDALVARGERDVAAVVLEVAFEFEKHSLGRAERLYREGRLEQVRWEAYCYLWRNGAARFSGQLESYQLSLD